MLEILTSRKFLKGVIAPDLERLQGPVEKGLPRDLTLLWQFSTIYGHTPVHELLPLVPQGVLVTVCESELDVDAAEPELGSAPRVSVSLNVLKIETIGFQEVSKRGPDPYAAAAHRGALRIVEGSQAVVHN